MPSTEAYALYGRLGQGEASCQDVADGEILEVGPLPLIPYRQ
jgi:hypothetical protein